MTPGRPRPRRRIAGPSPRATTLAAGCIETIRAAKPSDKSGRTIFNIESAARGAWRPVVPTGL